MSECVFHDTGLGRYSTVPPASITGQQYWPATQDNNSGQHLWPTITITVIIIIIIIFIVLIIIIISIIIIIVIIIIIIIIKMFGRCCQGSWPMMLASDTHQWWWRVLLASGVNSAGQWCWPVVLPSGAVQLSLANLASLLCGMHTHACTCSNAF